MKRFKLMMLFFAAVLMMLVFTACGSSDTEETAITEEMKIEETNDDSGVTCEGLFLAIPEQYMDLLVVETKDNSPDGDLFKVSEKASIEAAEGMDESSPDGAGWLFSIGRVDEKSMQEMLCGDMSGAQIFGKDKEGNYYVFYTPTDVRLIRANNKEMDEAMDQWTELNEWKGSVPPTFLMNNPEITEEKYGNTELDIRLAQIAYQDDVNYTISTTEAGPMEPGDVDPSPYLDKLRNGVTYEYADGIEAPDGEYVVLNFPDDNVRFDFFLAEGSENIIRQVWGDSEEIYKANFDDDSIKASQVMEDWYHAIMK